VLAVHPHGLGAEPQRLATGAAAVLRARVEHHADVPGGVGDPPVALTEDRGAAAAGVGESADHPQRRRLPGAVGAEEAGDRPRLAGERDVVDGQVAAEALAESLRLDHARPEAMPMGRKAKRLTR
jgi:hypothetical protein